MFDNNDNNNNNNNNSNNNNNNDDDNNNNLAYPFYVKLALRPKIIYIKKEKLYYKIL